MHTPRQASRDNNYKGAGLGARVKLVCDATLSRRARARWAGVSTVSSSPAPQCASRRDAQCTLVKKYKILVQGHWTRYSEIVCIWHTYIKHLQTDKGCCRNPAIVLRQGNHVAKTCDPPLVSLVTPTGWKLQQLFTVT